MPSQRFTATSAWASVAAGPGTATLTFEDHPGSYAIHTSVDGSGVSAGFTAESDKPYTINIDVGEYLHVRGRAGVVVDLAVTETAMTRAQLVAYVAGRAFPINTVMFAGGLAYRYIGTGTAIADMPGWVPDGTITPLHFGADKTGATSSNAAIQAAVTYAATLTRATDVYFPGGVYLVAAAITIPAGVRMRGEGQNTVIVRTFTTGDTFTQTGGAADIRGFYFAHSTAYVAGDTSLADRVTGAYAHIRLTDCSSVNVEENLFWRMPYGLILDGCHIGLIRRNRFRLTWDADTTALQEGVADLLIDHTNRYSQLIDVRDNYFQGCAGLAANRTYTDANALSVTKSVVKNVGAKNSMLIRSCEGLSVTGNYFGRAAEHLVNYQLNVTSATRLCLNHRYAGNFFDNAGSTTHSQINVEALVTGARLAAVAITGNTFNGQLDTLRAITAVLGVSNAESMTGFQITGNHMLAHVGSPIVLDGAAGGSISGNVISWYNSINVCSDGADKKFSSGIWAGTYATDIGITGNTLGSAQVTFVTGATNYCYHGIYLVAPTGTIRTATNLNAGCLSTFNNSSYDTVGTVAHDGTQSNGAVMERGGDGTNGYYEKMADGSIRCWHTITTSNTAAVTWTFPATFITAPVISGMAEASALIVITYQDRTTTTVGINSWNQAGSRSAAITACVEAVGRWRA